MSLMIHFNDTSGCEVSRLDENSNESAFNFAPAPVPSPLKKRGRPDREISENSDQSSGHLFQTNSLLSQGSWDGESSMFSQDMSDRIGLMTFQSSQDDHAPSSNIDESSSESSHKVPFVPFRRHSATLMKKKNTETMKKVPCEKKITINPPIKNIFLESDSFEIQPTERIGLCRHLSAERYIEAPPKPVDIWVEPYQERPYYMTNFHQEAILGEGTFSMVFKARKRLDGCLYAIKKLKSRISREAEGDAQMKEVCALAALQGCEHIVRYYSCWIEDSQLWIQTELCLPITLDIYVLGMPRQKAPTGSNSFTALSQDGFGNPSEAVVTTIEGLDTSFWPSGEPIPEHVAWIGLKTVAEALDYMHMRGIAHLDIRPANVFISELHPSRQEQMSGFEIFERISDVSQGILSGNLKLKLGDMGLCCPLHDPRSASDGDARYCSSELISGFDSGSELQPSRMDLTKADIFSLGASIYELFKGAALAGHSSLIDENGLSEWQLLRMCILNSAVVSRYSPQLTSLVKAMLAPNPEDRPSAKMVVYECDRYQAQKDRTSIVSSVDKENLAILRAFVSRYGLIPEEDVISQVSSILSNQSFVGNE